MRRTACLLLLTALGASAQITDPNQIVPALESAIAQKDTAAYAVLLADDFGHATHCGFSESRVEELEVMGQLFDSPVSLDFTVTDAQTSTGAAGGSISLSFEALLIAPDASGWRTTQTDFLMMAEGDHGWVITSWIETLTGDDPCTAPKWTTARRRALEMLTAVEERTWGQVKQDRR